MDVSTSMDTLVLVSSSLVIGVFGSGFGADIVHHKNYQRRGEDRLMSILLRSTTDDRN